MTLNKYSCTIPQRYIAKVKEHLIICQRNTSYVVRLLVYIYLFIFVQISLKKLLINLRGIEVLNLFNLLFKQRSNY